MEDKLKINRKQMCTYYICYSSSISCADYQWFRSTIQVNKKIIYFHY